jgi:putative transposase
MLVSEASLGLSKETNMKGQKHTPAQIIEKLRIADIELANGATQEQIAAKLDVTEVTLSRWREKYGGMQAEEARRLKELEQENARLKRLVADLALDKQILQELVKKTQPPGSNGVGG